MKSWDFNHILEKLLDNVKSTLTKKNAEYATDNDKLHNFRGIEARFGGRFTALDIARILQAKHTQSVDDLITTYHRTGRLPTPETLDEKIGDEIAYNTLIYALFLEEINKKLRNEPYVNNCASSLSINAEIDKMFETDTIAAQAMMDNSRCNHCENFGVLCKDCFHMNQFREAQNDTRRY